eukprot:CAMPEP_0114461398 /NCGR_PEP_ID=MMETSP0104-20121206/6254_1 /TAXON_ID=37642 ORGANISM="Paraphysomonas imperforata, Strain PA2" /NCGR_SAMPLE_ID=MMETSP0104 /ASSEMBLY_ACC=CAM_ASM_000202 /LENGTH=451 /DNA_ID=CAMNT_0001634167 /DNA_START=49 /DNA_END=1404 /DNA_ORIENTATION=+
MSADVSPPSTSPGEGGAQLRGYTLGIVFIIIVAVIWAGASVLTQYIYNDLDFESPFLVTYISTTLFALYLPMWRLWVWLGYVEDPPLRRRPPSTAGPHKLHSYQHPASSPLQHSSDTTSESSSVESAGLLENTAEAIVGLMSAATSTRGASYEPLPPEDTAPRPTHSTTPSPSSTVTPPEPHNSHEEVLVIAMKVAPLWFLANCLYNYSLLLTSVGSSTIISNLSGSFTLMFAYLVGIERITGGKLLALFVSLGGVALIAVQDENDDSPQTFFGDLVALGAAAFYGLYTTTIRVQVPEEEGAQDAVSMQLLFGYIGALTAVGLSPCLFFLSVFHLGNLAELTGEVFGFLVLGSIFNNVISDYLWARSVVLTSPTIATVGLSITIPLAILSDFVFFGTIPTVFSGSGAVLVIVGFVIISAEQRLRGWLKEYLPVCVCWDEPDRDEQGDRGAS